MDIHNPKKAGFATAIYKREMAARDINKRVKKDFCSDLGYNKYINHTETLAKLQLVLPF